MKDLVEHAKEWAEANDPSAIKTNPEDLKAGPSIVRGLVVVIKHLRDQIEELEFEQDQHRDKA